MGSEDAKIITVNITLPVAFQESVQYFGGPAEVNSPVFLEGRFSRRRDRAARGEMPAMTF